MPPLRLCPPPRALQRNRGLPTLPLVFRYRRTCLYPGHDPIRPSVRNSALSLTRPHSSHVSTVLVSQAKCGTVRRRATLSMSGGRGCCTQIRGVLCGHRAGQARGVATHRKQNPVHRVSYHGVRSSHPCTAQPPHTSHLTPLTPPSVAPRCFEAAASQDPPWSPWRILRDLNGRQCYLQRWLWLCSRESEPTQLFDVTP
jgi:hypothetical protein